MAVKRISSDIDVVTAARQRIKNVFSNGVPVYLSFSGGKDSIVLADLTYKLIQAGEINPSQLTVLFVDEEAIFDSIEATTKAWRKKFLLAGAKFQWWCIEVKHFSCLNELSSDEPSSAGIGASAMSGCGSRRPLPSAITRSSGQESTTINPSCPA